MAASVVYGTWDGQIISENRGGVVRDYIPDPLGNTIALIDENHTITDTWTYWPYGEIQSHGGSSTTQLTFLGTLGYFRDFLNQLYVRARHLRVDVTRWMTVDPLWPRQSAHMYVDAMPLLVADWTGAGPKLRAGRDPAAGCVVWQCNARRFLSHACIEVEGPHGGCSGSIDMHGFYQCPGLNRDPEDWDCNVVSTDCGYAANVCKCIKEFGKGGGGLNFWIHGMCWGFSQNVQCCACHGLPDEAGCERAHCPVSGQAPGRPGTVGSGGGTRFRWI